MGTDFLRDEDATNLTPLSHIVRLGNRGELEQFGPYGGDWTIGPSRSGPIDEIDEATRRRGASVFFHSIYLDPLPPSHVPPLLVDL